MQTVHLARVAVAGKGETDCWVQILLQEVLCDFKISVTVWGLCNSILN